MKCGLDTTPKSVIIVPKIHLCSSYDSAHVFGNSHDNIGSMCKLTEDSDEQGQARTRNRTLYLTMLQCLHCGMDWDYTALQQQ